MGTEDTIRNAVRDWIKATASGSALTDAQVIDGSVTSVRPPLPYIAVTLLVWDMPVGFDEFSRSESGANPTVAARGDRRATVSVQGFGATTADWIESAHRRLDLPTAEAIMAAAGLTLLPIGGSSQTPTVIDTGKEKRYLREYEVYYSFTSDPETQTPTSSIVLTQTYQSESGDHIDTITIYT